MEINGKPPNFQKRELECRSTTGCRKKFMGTFQYLCPECTARVQRERKPEDFVEKKFVGDKELGYIDNRRRVFVVTNHDLMERIRKDRNKKSKKEKW